MRHCIPEMTLTDVSRREGGRGLASTEDSVGESIKRLEDNIKNPRGRLMTATRNNSNNTRISRTTITRKQMWEEKQLYWRFKRLTNDISHEQTWLRKGNLKRESKSLLTAAQDNTIKINRSKQEYKRYNSKCWLFDDKDKTINFIWSECSKLPHIEYKTRYNWEGKDIKRELHNNWSMHKPRIFPGKSFWDFDKQTDNLISERRPDFIKITKKKRELAELWTLLSHWTTDKKIKNARRGISISTLLGDW